MHSDSVVSASVSVVNSLLSKFQPLGEGETQANRYVSPSSLCHTFTAVCSVPGISSRDAAPLALAALQPTHIPDLGVFYLSIII